jgi:hypothetical protein
VKSPEEIAAEKAEGVRARLHNIETGEFSRRSAEREPIDPVERELDRLVKEHLRELAKTQGKRLAKVGTEDFNRVFQAAKAKWSEKLLPEAKRRVANASKLDATGLDI